MDRGSCHLGRAPSGRRPCFAGHRSGGAGGSPDPAAAAAIAAAGRDTAAARSLTDDPVWRAVAGVPYAGRSVRTVAGVARAADDVARSVLPPALAAARSLASDRVRRPDGTVDIALIRTATAPVASSASRLEAVRRAVHALPQANVVGPIARARDQFATQVDDLAEVLGAAESALQVAPALLGADRPRRYFVLVQQTSESRGTGGLPGGFAILETDKGRIRVSQSGSNADLRDGPVPVPAGVRPTTSPATQAVVRLPIWRMSTSAPTCRSSPGDRCCVAGPGWRTVDGVSRWTALL